MNPNPVHAKASVLVSKFFDFRIVPIVVLALVLQLSIVSSSQAASFEGIGDLSGGSYYSEANGISANGIMVVGASRSELGLEAIIWTKNSGIKKLGEVARQTHEINKWNDLPGGSYMSRALAIHPDGVGGGVIGYSSSNTGIEGFYWGWHDGMRGIGQFNYGNYSVLKAVSRGGYVGVANWDHWGKLSSPRHRAMYLSSTNFSTPKIHCLNDPDNMFYCPNKVPIDATYQYYEPASSYNAVSDNGIKVGSKANYALYNKTSLGFLPGGQHSSASDISRDGKVVIGSSDSYSGTQVFRWTQSTGMQGLGFKGSSLATSYDGSVIVGSNSYKAFIWTKASGIQYLQDILENEYGLDLTGWHLISATDLSADGLAIIGSGYHDGKLEGWIARLDALPTANKSPIANAGPDQTVSIGTLVQLDANAPGDPSSDPDGNYPLTYSWTLTPPAGSAAVLSDNTSAIPTFTTDVLGDYTATLVVTDSKGKSSAPDTVVISTVNSAPVATIAVTPGLSIVEHGTTVLLDGGGSTDPDGDTLTFNWSLTSPAGSTATLVNPTEIMPSFIPDVHSNPVDGNYVVELTVTDPHGATDTATVTITFDNIPPVASATYAEAGLILIEGDTINLSGSGSDANLDAISKYTWILTPPAGSGAFLSDVKAQNPSFIADIAGDYNVSLVVTDQHGLDSAAFVMPPIIVKTQEEAVSDAYNDLVTEVTTLSPDVFDNANQQNALSNKLDAVFGLIDQGKYKQALDKLQNDILGKTDGCANGGTPDGNDWIDSCEVQESIYDLVTKLIVLLSK